MFMDALSIRLNKGNLKREITMNPLRYDDVSFEIRKICFGSVDARLNYKAMHIIGSLFLLRLTSLLSYSVKRS